MKPKTPRHFSLASNEWLLRAGDNNKYTRDIIVTYKGIRQKVTGIIFIGELREK